MLLAALLGRGAASADTTSATSAAASSTADAKIRGVNLGGWLVLERWIKPSMMKDGFEDLAVKPKDQWTFTKYLGKEEAKERLTEHWDTWVDEDTFDQIKAAGLNHVRVPLGHWILGDIDEKEPYVDGDWYYFKRAAGWARERGIQMWIDLHTAPGSQNGFDNSGRFGNATWATSPENIDRTVTILGSIAKQIKDDGIDDVVTGFGLLNEPNTPSSFWTLLDFYNLGYAAVRAHLPDVRIYIGDGFKPADLNWFWDNTDAGNPITTHTVAMDSHVYACFNDDLRPMTPRQHIEQVCVHEREHVNECCWHKDTSLRNMERFVGEWTVAYDQTPSEELEDMPVRPMTEARKIFLRQYAEAQMVVWEQDIMDVTNYDETGQVHHGVDMKGWFFWNFKMEHPAYIEWDYLEGIKQGWIPKFDGKDHNKLAAVDILHTCDALIAAAQPFYEGVVDPYPPLYLPPDGYGGGDTSHDWKHQLTRFMIVAAVIALGFVLFRAIKSYRADQCQGLSPGSKNRYVVVTDDGAPFKKTGSLGAMDKVAFTPTYQQPGVEMTKMSV